MAENLGEGVSYVSESAGYNYDMVVFQEQKPPLDSELNLSQELKRLAGQRRLDTLPSGWLTLRPYYTEASLVNKFYSQDPDSPIPEYALVNGMVVHVTNTNTDPLVNSVDNNNYIDLGEPPSTGNRVNGVFLEVWRALLDPDTVGDPPVKPAPDVVIDDLNAVDAQTANIAWGVGANGLILNTQNAGASWSVQLIDTKQVLNGVSFANTTIGWVVGNGGVIGRTSSGGVTWNMLSTGLVENLNDVHAASQVVVYAVGDAGTILKTVNGITWVGQTSGVTAKLNGVFFYDTLIGWAVGAGGTILKTTDGGSNWIALTSGITTDLNSIVFYDLNIGFAVGAGGVILRTSDGGLTWVAQSGNIWDTDTSTYSSLSVNYNDVTMAPNLDEYVDGEEVSGQFSGSNKNCTVMNVPVTKGDGLGTVTNTPGDITVKVNDVEVLVDVLDGITGQIILHEAPEVCDTVKVYYYYKVSTEIFRGRAWIVGDSGTTLVTDDLGAKWIPQDPDTAYDINSIDFVDINTGWLGGQFSTIRFTLDGGTTWQTQVSDVVSRQQQRVYKEGNVDTDVYLVEDTIHPDTNIETTKRVQIQYRIRIESSVDPINYPEAGLGNTGIVGLGPNETGSFSFENMGETTGDYGLWQAKCPNTVDGYCWAIPMAFAGRRNSLPFDLDQNANGSHTEANPRPDLLTGTDIVEADILDVRRKVVVPDVNELLERSFDLLMSNQFRTQMGRDTQGGDRYGTEILNVDRIGGADGDGGREITGAALADAIAGDIKSTVVVSQQSESLDATAEIPVSYSLAPLTAPSIFHPNPVYYSVIYVSATSPLDGTPVKGYWEGYGTVNATFYFDVNTKTSDDDIDTYALSAGVIDASSDALTFIPTDPKYTVNYSSDDDQLFYQGVLDTETSGRTIESWDSGITGYTNLAKAYPYEGSTDEQYRASPVVVTYHMKLVAGDIIDPNTINVPQDITAGSASPTISYQAYTVKSLKDVTTATTNYHLSDQKPVTVGSETKIQLVTTGSFNFIVDMVVEIEYMIESNLGSNNNIRNGASLSFNQSDKGIKNFIYSDVFTIENETGPISTFTFDIPNHSTLNIAGTFIGVSSVDTGTSPQTFMLVNNSAITFLHPVTVTSFGGATLEVTFDELPIGTYTLSIQAVILQTALKYQGSTDGLLIGYNYTPFQAVSGLPTTLNTQMATMPKNLYVSNLGTGGSLFTRDPYDNPLVQIPTGDSAIANDNSFYNVDLFRFPTFSVDGGFVQVPVLVPGSFGTDVTFSTAVTDNLSRAYYSVADKEFLFKGEGIKIGLARKMFVPILARVAESSDDKLLRGEYVLLIVSRNTILELENYAGYEADGNSVIAVYRLPNKPIMRF